jgi:hypothetical protein
VPEEAPEEIAELIQRCTGDADQRPDAHECAEIIAPFLRAVLLRGATRSCSEDSPKPKPPERGRSAPPEMLQTAAEEPPAATC